MSKSNLVLLLLLVLVPAMSGAQTTGSKKPPAPQVKKTPQEEAKQKADMQAHAKCGLQARKQKIPEKGPEFGKFMGACLKGKI
jgi:hypothetical protein